MDGGSPTVSLAKRLVSDNKRPTREEDATLRAAIPNLRSAVRKIESEFNEVDIALAILPPETTPDPKLKAQFDALSTQLGAAQEVLAVHMQAITFARQIPVEVLQSIFLFALPASQFIKPSANTAPLLLCQICSPWRRVALNLPQLWTSLSLRTDRGRRRWRDLIEMWLGRTAEAPLTMSFLAGSEGIGDVAYFNDHVVRMLRPSQKRWRQLQLEVPGSTTTKLLNADLPLLETLELNTRGDSAGIYLSSADAPRLRKVSVVGAKSNPAVVYVAYDQLAELHVPDFAIKLDDLYQLLSKCRNLQRCSITMDPASTPTNRSLEYRPVSLPRLRDLSVSVRMIAGAPLASLFLELKTPALKALELVNQEPNTTFGLGDESALASFARESNLQKLTLVGGDPEEGLFSTVVVVPSLREVFVAEEPEAEKRTPESVRETLRMREDTE
ncbi:F-box domain-containing protein [Mycena chlorophos]|uniref:F-box domain-containing protein n=1 Tax=Mycena chlorophos TaxID=658473 RepID=A0A8H6SHJ3_MYCCL|nr:F-box domain-containing protein [Mycena chlorophos]